MPVERTSDRMRRLLVLVPWVVAREGVPVDEVCARFGVTPAELAADVALLMVCGLPPFSPADYIEAFIDDGKVTISTAQALDRPPRLTQQEGLELLVAGRAIAALHDLPAGGPLDTALGKLARALSPSDAQAVTDLADRIAVRLDTPGSALLPLLGEAIEGRRRVRMAYYVWGRGEMSEREVDPLLVLQQEGHWYLVGADVPSGEQRSFRVDRIREAVLTHATFDHPAWFDAARYADGLPFEPAAGDAVATIEIAPEASWIAEMIPHVAALDAGEGWRRIDVRTASTAWLVRLLLSAGPTARAVAPPELVDAVRAEAARALARYAGA